MTAASAIAAPLVLDATCLSHFARADRLDVLRDLLVGKECWTTEIVLAELNRCATGHRLPCTGTGFPAYARQHKLT